VSRAGYIVAKEIEMCCLVCVSIICHYLLAVIVSASPYTCYGSDTASPDRELSAGLLSHCLRNELLTKLPAGAQAICNLVSL
jgi:hypothetical protein